MRGSDWTAHSLDRAIRDLNNAGLAYIVWDRAAGRIDGMTPAIMVALGEDGIKTMDDLAGCATDDLVGWSERKEDETVRHDGALSALDVSGAEAEAMIMQARIVAGWITEEELNPEEPEGEEGDGSDAEAGDGETA